MVKLVELLMHLTNQFGHQISPLKASLRRQWAVSHFQLIFLQKRRKITPLFHVAKDFCYTVCHK